MVIDRLDNAEDILFRERARGWVRPPRWLVVLYLGIVGFAVYYAIAVGSGIEWAAPIGPIEVPIGVFLVGAIAVAEVWRLVGWATTRYVVKSPPRLTVSWGLLRVRLQRRLWLKPEETTVDPSGRGLVVRTPHGCVCLEGVDRSSLESLRGAIGITASGQDPVEPPPPKRVGVRWLVLLGLVSVLALVAGELRARANARSYAALVRANAVLAATTGAIDGAVLPAESAAKALLDAELQRRHGPHASGSVVVSVEHLWDDLGGVWTTWRFRTISQPIAAERPELVGSVIVIRCTRDLHLIPDAGRVTVEAKSGWEGQLILDEVCRQLDAAGVSYTVVPPSTGGEDEER